MNESTTLPPEYMKYKSLDPFPEIQPALLNSADIFDYVCAVKMVDPFSPPKLKPASYEVPFSGTVISWDSKTSERRVQKIDGQNEHFVLDSNAIAFVSPDTTFRLPDYIAMRFNLQIAEVHRGLLLGTGPLVDPGFCGELLIPLHNLTANKYTLIHGKGLIWVEFTKLSTNSKWAGELDSKPPRSGKYIEFDQTKTFQRPDDYFRKATGNLPIVSSIPAETQRARAEAERASKNAAQAETHAARAFSMSTLNLVLSVLAVTVTVVLGGVQLTNIYKDVVNTVVDAKLKGSRESTDRRLDELQREIEDLRGQVSKKGSSTAPTSSPTSGGNISKPAKSDGKKG